MSCTGGYFIFCFLPLVVFPSVLLADKNTVFCESSKVDEFGGGSAKEEKGGGGGGEWYFPSSFTSTLGYVKNLALGESEEEKEKKKKEYDILSKLRSTAEEEEEKKRKEKEKIDASSAEKKEVTEEKEEEKIKSEIGVYQYAGNESIEDKFFIGNLKSKQNEDLLMTAVFDGHGGADVAEYARDRLAKIIQEKLTSDENPSVEDAMETAFLHFDDELEEKVKKEASVGLVKSAFAGACALVVLLDSQRIFVGNCGDCKAVLCQGGKAIPLNQQHNCDAVYEQERLMREHPNENNIFRCTRVEKVLKEKTPADYLLSLFGMYTDTYEDRQRGCYIKDLLNPTRSFGDFYLKKKDFNDSLSNAENELVQPPFSFPYITAAPQVDVYARHESQEFVLLSSDGLFEILSDEECVSIARDFLATHPQKFALAAEHLVEKALEKAAEEYGITVEELKSIPQGRQRRSLHDDLTVCILPLK